MSRLSGIVVFFLLAACRPAVGPGDAGFVSTGIGLASRGVTVPGTLVIPAAGSKPAPLVLMAHGHGGSRDEAGSFARVAEGLASRGIASLRIDFPGCGASSEPFEYNNLDNMLADLSAADAFARALPEVDSGSIGVLGYSMGGRVALLYAGSEDVNPAIAAMVLWAPVADAGAGTMMQFIGGERAWQRLRDRARIAGAGEFMSPWGQEQRLGLDWFVGLEKSDPLAAVERYEAPLLVIHGETDEVVPPSVSRLLVAAAPGPVRLVTLRDTGHGFGFFDAGDTASNEVVEATVAFFEQAL